MLRFRIVTEALVDWEQSGGARPELGPIPEGHPPSPPRLLPASSISRREAVVNQIRRGIVLGVLRPGEKLTEVSLASTLRVSRPTVREALAQLAQEGLLTAEPYRGLRVTEIDAAAIRDLAQTRLALDRLAIQAITGDATDRRMDSLLQAWHVYQATVDGPDSVARHDAHLAFHQAIWLASDNVLLEQLWPVIEAHMTIALAEDQRARPNPERSRRIHGALVDSIAARHPDRIEAALQAHTAATAEELIALRHPPGKPQDRPAERTDS
jgi:DNA-binding GntR family transcriptional regulator